MSRQVFSKSQRRKYNSAYLNKKIHQLPNIANKSQSSLISQCASESLLQRIKEKHMFDLTHYDNMTDNDIRLEHQDLVVTLKSMNSHIANLLERLETMPLPAEKITVDREQVLHVTERQIENNKRLHFFFQNQWQMIRRRQKYLQENTREAREAEIRKTTEDIEKMRQKIKKIRRTSIAMANSLLDEESLIREIKDLEKTKAFIKQKNEKARQQLERCNENNEQIQMKSSKIHKKYLQAQKNILSLAIEENEQAKKNKMDLMLNVKQGIVKELHKKLQVSNNQNEQQYFGRLKQLDKMVQNINDVLNKTMEISAKIVETKKQIALLTRQMRNPKKAEMSADNLMLNKVQTQIQNNSVMGMPYEQRKLNRTIHETSRSSLGHKDTMLLTDVPPPDRQPTPPPFRPSAVTQPAESTNFVVDLPKMKKIQLHRINKFFNEQTTFQQS